MKVDDESFLHDKDFVLKKHLLQKTTLSSLKMSELEIFLWLTQFGKKAIFYPKMVAPPKQIISHQCIRWYMYQCIISWKMLSGEY